MPGENLLRGLSERIFLIFFLKKGKNEFAFFLHQPTITHGAITLSKLNNLKLTIETRKCRKTRMFYFIKNMNYMRNSWGTNLRASWLFRLSL